MRNVKEYLSLAFIGSDRYGGARHYVEYLSAWGEEEDSEVPSL